MHLSMEIGLTPKLVQELKIGLELAISGGLTDTIFPKVEQWFDETRKSHEIFHLVSKKKNMSKYKSVMDFLVCETFTHLRPLCFAFYEGKGRLLLHDISDHQRDKMEKSLLCMLKLAKLIYDKKLAFRGWKHFVEESFDLERRMIQKNHHIIHRKNSVYYLKNQPQAKCVVDGKIVKAHVR